MVELEDSQLLIGQTHCSKEKFIFSLAFHQKAKEILSLPDNSNQKIRIYAFSETVLGKSGPCEAALAQFIEFRCQVSGFGCQETEVLNPDT